MWTKSSNIDDVSDRRVSIQISVGTGYDPTASDDVSNITSDERLPMSNIAQILDVGYTITSGLATFEGDGIPTSLSAGMVAPPLLTQDRPPDVGIWSSSISGADSSMNWSFTIMLSSSHTSALTIRSYDTEIRTAYVSYSLGGATVRAVTLESNGDSLVDVQETTFDSVTVTVLKLSGPYLHARIAEVEFGAVKTIPQTLIGETAGLVREIDPLLTTIPIDEFDFSLVNVDGDFDADNPDNMLGLVELRSPVILTIVTETDSWRTSVPMGRYYITSRKGAGTELRVTAQDARAILQSTIQPVSLSSTEAIGETIRKILEGLDIPYVIESSSMSVYPKDIVIEDKEYDILTQLCYIRQMYGIVVVPERDGLIHVRAERDASTAPDLDAVHLIDFPVQDSTQSYNGVTVFYGQGLSVTLDLRASNTDAKSFLSINNPLISSEEEAYALADRMKDRIFTQVYRAEAIGDPTPDPGDLMAIAGRWTQNNPVEYMVVGIEMDYGGDLLMTVRAIRT